MAQPSDSKYDVIIAGGGPSGSTAGLQLARAGFRALILEKATHPRFHVGESFLPRNFELIRELGLLPKLRRLTHMPKFGAEFGMGHSPETTRFSFASGLIGGENETFNIERAPFDHMLLAAAAEAGADVVQGTGVRRVLRLADGDVAIETDAGARLSARYLLDASGQGCLLGKHLGTRRVFPHHRKIAYFNHFKNVQRLCGREEGYPTVAMCDEGWFWMIPIDPVRTSIGLVLDADAAKTVNVPANQMLAWGVARCPLVAGRLAHAVFPESNHVNADFSYTCAPYAGPGYFLVGDSAVFLDPIFSTGICLGMTAAVEAARLLGRVFQGTMSPAGARRRYVRVVSAGSSTFFKLVNLYYHHSFRELFLNGEGPFDVHRAVISLLAGHVFPRPTFSIRWRGKLFESMIRVNRRLALVPRRERFSLVNSGQASVFTAVSASAMDLCRAATSIDVDGAHAADSARAEEPPALPEPAGQSGAKRQSGLV